jgi:hypothetical protein
MNQIVKPLPQPVQSRIAYDSIMVENLIYDPINKAFVARVYGVCRGMTVPLIISTNVAMRRVDEVTISDVEIDAVQAEKPEITDRLDAAMVRAYARLVALANEQPPFPY